VNGTIAVAILEGAVIGFAYNLKGVPHPVWFTFLTVALATVPFAAWLALGVAALTLAFQDGTLLVPAALFAFGGERC
jgi:predicted PurR-regulated permease PerM